VTYVPEDDDEKEGASRQTTHGFAPGDVFMVFEYVDYDLSGLLKCRDVVRTYVTAQQITIASLLVIRYGRVEGF
jgi:hypothetical protein